MADLATPTTAHPVPVPAPAPEPRRPDGRVTSLLAEAGDLLTFSGHAIAALRRTPRYASEVLRQAAALVAGSTLIVAAMSFFIGVVVVTFAFYFLRSAGASDFVGGVTGIFDPRAATPLMFGYIIAAKVGSGLTAEIGTMRIAEEIDALEAEAVDPMTYVIGTRLAATLLFLPLAAAVALVMSTAGSYVNAVHILDAVPSGVFLRDHWAFQNVTDQLFGLGVMGITGVCIVLTACFFGYRVDGGPAGVGVGVARSLVVNLILVHVIVSVALVTFYGTDVGLPIGGGT